MTDQAERLFDVNPYGGGETPAEKRRRVAGGLEPQLVEPRTQGWMFLRNRQGVMPYAHLVGSQAASGATMTACGKIGTLLATDVGSMIRCSACSDAPPVG